MHFKWRHQLMTYVLCSQKTTANIVISHICLVANMNKNLGTWENEKKNKNNSKVPIMSLFHKQKVQF